MAFCDKKSNRDAQHMGDHFYCNRDFAIIIAIIGTKELLSNGVKFSDDEAEFTGVDDNNIVAYDDIITIEAYRDTAASFTKNFDMRHSLLILH